MRQRDFGKNTKGEAATMYTFENAKGMVMEVSDFGATLYSLQIPDKDGVLRDVVLGYDDPVGYEGPSGTFFGATVGRNANRIGQGKFVINGRSYQLDRNNNGNNLHSGLDFYSFRIWDVKQVTENSITFSMHSPDGDQGYPGELDVDVTYTLTEDSVQIDYCGLPKEDTVINMTNHSYFNLNGHESGPITEHLMWLDADAFTPTDVELIPTGEILPVEGTPMDFRVAKKVGRDINEPFEALVFGQGYDHNWCLNNDNTFAKVAELTADVSGIKMEVYTDLPGVQIYSGNFLVEEPGKGGVVYKHRQGICFETQYYPDSLNHENFSDVICKAGQEYQTRTVYRFTQGGQDTVNVAGTQFSVEKLTEEEKAFLETYAGHMAALADAAPGEAESLYGPAAEGNEEALARLVEIYVKGEVLKVASEMCGKGVCVAELIEEGNVGVVLGLEKLTDVQTAHETIMAEVRADMSALFA